MLSNALNMLIKEILFYLLKLEVHKPLFWCIDRTLVTAVLTKVGMCTLGFDGTGWQDIPYIGIILGPQESCAGPA